MSQIFEYLLESSRAVNIYDSMGEESWQVTHRGMKGLNQIILPTFATADRRIPESSIELRFIPSSLDSLNIVQEEKLGSAQITYFVPSHHNPELDTLISQVGRYTEIENHRSQHPISAQLAPRELESSNKSHFYISLSAISPRTERVQLQLGPNYLLSFRGAIELYLRDKSFLNIYATLPYGSKLRASYAQILPKRESLLSRLRKSQYALAQV